MLFAHACATARTALGWPMPRATSPYDCDFAVRNRLQIAPDAHLERRAAHVERQVERGALAFEVIAERAHPRIERRGLRLRHRRVRRFRILVDELLLERLLAVAELDEADAAIGCADHQHAERRFRAGVRDRKAAAAVAVLQRRHAEARVDALVDAARRAEAGIVDRIGDAAAGLEAGFQLLDALGFVELLRREADARLERALEMERAHADGRSDLLQRQRLVGVLRDQLARVADARVDGIALRGDVRLAAAARAQAVALGFGRRPIEADVLAQRPARRARRLAVDAGRQHAVDELAVLRRIARLDGIPADFGFVVHDGPPVGMGAVKRVDPKRGYPLLARQSGRRARWRKKRIGEVHGVEDDAAHPIAQGAIPC